MEPAALPAASTISRPDFGAGGRCGGRQADGCAAAIAVRNNPSRSALVAMPILSAIRRTLYRTAPLPIRKQGGYNASKERFLWEGIGRLNARLQRRELEIVARSCRSGRPARVNTANGGIRYGGRVYGQWYGTKRRCRRQHAAALGGARAPRNSPAPNSVAAPACAAPARSMSTARRCAPARPRCPRSTGKKVTTIEGLSADEHASAAEGLGRRAGAAMRLLPVRPDHAGGRIADEDQAAVTRADRRPHGRQHLPLRHLSAHRSRHPTRRAGRADTMNKHIKQRQSRRLPPRLRQRRGRPDLRRSRSAALLLGRPSEAYAAERRRNSTPG